jgi:hypothetical protein
MDLWQTRNAATESLQGPLQRHKSAIDEGFALIDENIETLGQADTQFSRVCALSAIKARNLALGCYSLALDGLAQESGALLRPLIEALELLTFFRLDPKRMELAVEGRLPKAGDVARLVEGHFKQLRKHLNDHASHFSFSYDSLRHQVDLRSFALRVTQPHNEKMLLTNLGTLSLFLEFLTVESFNCSSQGKTLEEQDVEKRIQAYRDLNTELFYKERTPSEASP